MKFNLKPKRLSGKNGVKGFVLGVEASSCDHPLEVALTELLKLPYASIPEGCSEVEHYPVNPPFAYVTIVQKKDSAEFTYIVDEVRLDGKEIEVRDRLINILERELEAPPDETKDLPQYFRKEAVKILADHTDEFDEVSKISMKKVLYYVERDTVGFGKIDPLMHDQLVEDISCSGANKPIFVWHKNFGSIKTNITYDCEQGLDDFVTGLVHRAGKHVSTAFPMVDVTLPGKHRLAISYGTEVTPFGTNFTIRKFREDPYTIIDLISMGTIDETLAAYLWMLMENKMSLMILGTTGAGKTTALNAIACLIPPTNKVITIEEVGEINLPHENWISMIPRYSFSLETEHAGEIPLYDLMKSAVRHRPDYIMVGEVRGEEAFVLFQALATGHGGLCTLHAEDINTAVKRLTSPPMNISSSNISLMNCAILVQRIESTSFTGTAKIQLRRKFAQVSEIVDKTPRDIFVWDSMSDMFDNKLPDSVLLRRIADKLDASLEELSNELERRKTVLQWMAERRIRNYLNVSRMIAEYSLSPQRVHDEASRALGR